MIDARLSDMPGLLDHGLGFQVVHSGLLSWGRYACIFKTGDMVTKDGDMPDGWY
jgi:hypothetical protein